jgi:hypothetical protein
MELPKEFFDILYPVVFVSIGLALVAYLTRYSRNFRSSRNKKARKQY